MSKISITPERTKTTFRLIRMRKCLTPQISLKVPGHRLWLLVTRGVPNSQLSQLQSGIARRKLNKIDKSKIMYAIWYTIKSLITDIYTKLGIGDFRVLTTIQEKKKIPFSDWVKYQQLGICIFHNHPRSTLKVIWHSGLKWECEGIFCQLGLIEWRQPVQPDKTCPSAPPLSTVGHLQPFYLCLSRLGCTLGEIQDVWPDKFC